MLHTGIGFYVYDVLLTLKFYYLKLFKDAAVTKLTGFVIEYFSSIIK